MYDFDVLYNTLISFPLYFVHEHYVLQRRNPALPANKVFSTKVDLLYLKLLTQAKNIPVVLPSSTIKFEANRLKGLSVMIRHKLNKVNSRN